MSEHHLEPLSVGFIGLGVMGEPMCRNLATKGACRVLGLDRSPQPLARLRRAGVEAADSIATLARDCSIVFMALPSGRHVEEVCTARGGLLECAKAGTTVVDLGTSPVDLTRRLAGQFADADVQYADAPIARTRQAAEDGTLSIMVGAEDATFAKLRPLLATMATDITLCGSVGSGQIVKILNNMVLVETVVALSEAIAIARRAGLDGNILFDTLSKGSADSFALRNHGMKAILPDSFPERAFSTSYARKDLSYALRLAAELGVKVPGALTADNLLREAAQLGYDALYWPVVSRVLAANVGTHASGASS